MFQKWNVEHIILSKAPLTMVIIGFRVALVSNDVRLDVFMRIKLVEQYPSCCLLIENKHKTNVHHYQS
jgi:hypothetical protein